MKLNDFVESMAGYLSEATIIDFLLMNRMFEDTRYSMMRRMVIDRVTTALIAAAKNKELFYDVAKWGEENKIANKATFSRRKDFLKNLGVISEEKVPMPFGRPKIRMLLNEDKLKQYFG